MMHKNQKKIKKDLLYYSCIQFSLSCEWPKKKKKKSAFSHLKYVTHEWKHPGCGVKTLNSSFLGEFGGITIIFICCSIVISGIVMEDNSHFPCNVFFFEFRNEFIDSISFNIEGVTATSTKKNATSCTFRARNVRPGDIFIFQLLAWEQAEQIGALFLWPT